MRGGFDVRTVRAYAWVHDLIAADDGVRHAAPGRDQARWSLEAHRFRTALSAAIASAET